MLIGCVPDLSLDRFFEGSDIDGDVQQQIIDAFHHALPAFKALVDELCP